MELVDVDGGRPDRRATFPSTIVVEPRYGQSIWSSVLRADSVLVRQALVGLLVVLIATAGCASTSFSSPTTRETPSSDAPTGSTTPSASSTPTPTPLPAVPKPGDDCDISTLPGATYPPLPAAVSESSATNFSLEFERAYAPASLDTQQGVTFSGFDGWRASVTISDPSVITAGGSRDARGLRTGWNEAINGNHTTA